jgi:hypothetical protein
LSGLASLAIGADEYPNRPVAIVVPFTPGASTDTLARFEADVLQRALHQSFVVENRPIAGGSGSIGLAAKIANSIGRSNTLRKAYAPVDIEAVRSVDDARVEGRRRLRAENKSGEFVSTPQPSDVSTFESEAAK